MANSFSTQPSFDCHSTDGWITCCRCGKTDYFGYEPDPYTARCKFCWHPICNVCVSKATVDESEPVRPQPKQSGVVEGLGYSNPPQLPAHVKKPTIQKGSKNNEREHTSAGSQYSKRKFGTSSSPKDAGPSESKEEYITEIAQDVFEKLKAHELDSRTVYRLSSNLFILLEAFVFNFGATSLIHYDIMVFIYKHREAIVASFKNMYQRTCRSYTKSNPMPTGDDTELQEELRDIYLLDDPVGQNETLNLPTIEKYTRLIFADPGYLWLLDRLRREITFANPDSHILDEIRSQIRQTVPPAMPLVRGKFPGYITIKYILDWDILGFLHSQEYNPSTADVIAKVITLTGSSMDAQALSCRDYMVQIWPSTGCKTLAVLQNSLKGNGSHEETFTSPSPLWISAEICHTCVLVAVSGIAEFVVEIGEQLAWLGAALRPSPPDNGIVHCTPVISFSDARPSSENWNLIQIDYKIENCETKSRDENGQCWHNLFANPTVVRGYPIPRRSETSTGLECPLDMLVTLARTRYIDTFKSKVFIKGFSTMLVPTRQSGDLLIWHLLYNDDPKERISYLDCGIGHADVDINTLEQHRHVLGWCSDTLSIVGTAQANYTIEKSRLSRVHSGCVLEKASVSGGKFVTATASFSLGNRETPVHISRHGYLNKLQWVSSKYFVFWDEEEKRGWLVDGASALLHILRASLEYSQRTFRSAWLLDLGNLRDAVEEPGFSPTLNVLINEENRNLRLYKDKTEVYDEQIYDQQIKGGGLKRKTTYYKLDDRIEHIYNILEKLIDHQADVEQRSGLKIKFRPRRQLEGWDFKDLATDGDPFFPRVAHLQAIGKGWVDFTRALHAVTLFGRGFGDLIRPQFGEGQAAPCPVWSIVPSAQYYLAVRIEDLEKIMDRDGDSKSDPRRLCENIIWHTKQGTFDLCPCTKEGTRNHHDPVQVLFPRKFVTNFEWEPQAKLENQGAVIFGHNMNIRWKWGDQGDPVEDNPSHSQASPPSNPENTAPESLVRRFQDMLSSSYDKYSFRLPIRIPRLRSDQPHPSLTASAPQNESVS
ncbi:uncharacterized protein GGS22DRAFT_15409 [Annulohypoxylon maeteangense]|uniref:uncharacterized protein n=1 Tax=Annulohypoxylon maeteangense TaxID=1927788 RepID=UPI00200744D3|nr:uncharacterized protein GGS22DRAFT_15409 [Annulohypoxylon maeteangense]KAI0890573.1 hypothetical protein GGS22DRAFT_15409 [Annulohypoxylon maeteangense]